jgi:hypothetical protein
MAASTSEEKRTYVRSSVSTVARKGWRHTREGLEQPQMLHTLHKCTTRKFTMHSKEVRDVNRPTFHKQAKRKPPSKHPATTTDKQTRQKV